MERYAAAVNNEVLGFMKDVRGLDQVNLTRQHMIVNIFQHATILANMCTERFDIFLEDKTRGLGYRLMESYAPTKKTESFPLFTLLCLLRPNQLLKRIQPTASKAGPGPASLPLVSFTSWARTVSSCSRTWPKVQELLFYLQELFLWSINSRSQICLVCNGKKSADDATIVCKGCNKLVHAACSSKARNLDHTLCEKCVLKRCSECNNIMPGNKTICLNSQ
jgi:hypothetical protein